jgi:hypothetical protein
MEDKTKLLFKAYLALSSNEKEAFQKAIREYSLKTILEQRNYSETLNRSLGPILSAKCTLCGK